MLQLSKFLDQDAIDITNKTLPIASNPLRATYHHPRVARRQNYSYINALANGISNEVIHLAHHAKEAVSSFLSEPLHYMLGKIFKILTKVSAAEAKHLYNLLYDLTVIAVNSVDDPRHFAFIMPGLPGLELIHHQVKANPIIYYGALLRVQDGLNGLDSLTNSIIRASGPKRVEIVTHALILCDSKKTNLQNVVNLFRDIVERIKVCFILLIQFKHKRSVILAKRR